MVLDIGKVHVQERSKKGELVVNSETLDSALKEVMQKNKDLGTEGFTHLYQPVVKDRFISVQQFEKCINFLIENEITSGNSYALKHEVERKEKTYIPHGALIAAVLFLGIPYKRYQDSPRITIKK